MQVTRFPSRADGVADRLAGFIAHLRGNGLRVGPAETRAALEALGAVQASDPSETRLALKVLLCPDQEVWRGFDDLFDAYWFNAGKTRVDKAQANVRRQAARPKLWQQHFDDDSGSDGDSPAEQMPGDGDGDAEGTDGRLIATRSDSLRKRDLRELMDEESLRAAERAAELLARALRDRRSRRRKRARRGRDLDMRRILRASLARGGEPLDLYRLKRPERPMRIVVLADVSGSMTAYARVFLAFVKGLVSADTEAEAFLFHTRLMRITSALKDHDTLRAAGRLSLMAEGFGGGTDIGGALRQFCDQHAGRVLNGRSVVIVLSDGYCTGRPEALAEGLARIRKTAPRIIWLNPLMGWAGYAPVAGAISAALPHLDAHLPANTIEALAALEPEFAKL